MVANDGSKKRPAQTDNIVRDVKASLETLQWHRQTWEAKISKALSPLVEPYAEFMRQMREVDERVPSWVNENREALRQFQAYLSNFMRVGAEIAKALTEASKQLQETLKRTDHIAKLGWTFPSHFYPTDLVHLAKLERREDADAFVLKWYGEYDPNLERMEARICENPAVSSFGTVLPQCFRSVRAGDYSIAIPSLIAVLENVILQLNPPNIISRDVKKTLRRGGVVAKDAEDNVVAAAVWLSLHTYINELYTDIPATSESVSPVLSRHGIQHGRIEAPNERLQAIRVLHTIETALSLKDGFSLRKMSKRKRLPSTASETKQVGSE
jgi:hypothetical protein